MNVCVSGRWLLMFSAVIVDCGCVVVRTQEGEELLSCDIGNRTHG
jgi:hypothetical protein